MQTLGFVTRVPALLYFALSLPCWAGLITAVNCGVATNTSPIMVSADTSCSLTGPDGVIKPTATASVFGINLPLAIQPTSSFSAGVLTFASATLGLDSSVGPFFFASSSASVSWPLTGVTDGRE